MRNLIFQFIILSFIVLTASVAIADNHIKLDADSEIIITEKGNDGGDDFCSDFTLTVSQVKAFFHKSSIITPRTMHNEYLWLSCYVRGQLINGDGKHTWEIRAGGTGHIKYANGEILYLGCKECEDGFR